MAQIGNALVVGASLTGLVTAAALAGHAERVTVLERDALPAAPSARKGLPHGRHLHSLMGSGQHALEALLPGVLDELVDGGAVRVGAPQDNLWLSPVGWCTRFPATHVVPSASRDLLDWTLRRRVSALPGVEFRTGVDVIGLTVDADGRAVTGVVTRTRSDTSVEEVSADLVVDATGRGTRTPRWLADLGFGATEKSVVDSRAAYSSRFYTIPADFDGDWRCISIGNQPPRTTRGGALIQVDGNRWLVSLFGHLGDHPPTQEEGFLEFAASLRHPVLYEAIRSAEPAGPIHGYAHMANQRWRYERLPNWPSGLLVLGDAACALNPVYAQGMSVAAMTAVELRDHLVEPGRDTVDCAYFQRRAAEITDRAWHVAVGADHGLLLPADGEIDEESRRIGEYMERVLQIALVDPVVNSIFFDVMMMVQPTDRLFAPDVADRVQRGPSLPARP